MADVGAVPVDPIKLIISIGSRFIAQELGIPTLDYLDPSTWFDPGVWSLGLATGTPNFLKTLETAQRLSTSTVPLVLMLGLHFLELDTQGRILSRDSDIACCFGPAIAYIGTTLFPQNPELAGPHLNNVIFGGQPMNPFDRWYFKQQPKVPSLLTGPQYLQLRPGKQFPMKFYNHLFRFAQRWSPSPPPPPPPPPPKPKSPCACAYTPQPRGLFNG